MTTTQTVPEPVSARPAHPLAAKDILFASASSDPSKPPQQHAVIEHQVLAVVRTALQGFEEGVREAVQAEIRRRADEMISAPVVDRLVAAWRQYSALLDAARETADHPGTAKLVDLASTEITSTNTWTVDVSVGVPIVSIDFTLTLVFTLHAAVATVRGGRLTRIGDGRCDVRATFTAMNQQLGDHREEIDLHDEVSFTPGILLVATTPHAEPTA
jgi:hypothetical protein